MTDPLGLLRDSLRSGSPPDASSIRLPDEPSSAYAVGRFLLSWAQAGELAADQAVLLRQALRWLEIDSLFVGVSPIGNTDFIDCLKQAGVDCDPGGELRAQPFAPKWLVDTKNCDTPPRKRGPDESFPAEAYLESIGYRRWRSQAQKEAAWSTVTAPLGSTRVVVLPTGSGKSLCFQLLPRFSSGLTVVVVPTIALAIDQQVNAARLFVETPDVNPLSFASDDNPEATALALREKRTRLLFTSPEACVSGRLRPILDSFAESGWLTNLVVDEAHLIETWGAQFRVEFQILAATRRAWREASDGKLRTFLFSATMSPGCRELLQKMFSNDDAPREFVCQRLRPEIEYYSRTFSNKRERDDAVVQALWQLPRPAILYVTERDDAEAFLARLRDDEGFKRVESFHGDTRRDDRKDILRRWKDNEIDLVVATSAFGVGVDKADVRTVLHACFPENLDRYYQEVGRGGRDGWSSVSLLMPAIPEDRRTAEGITVTLLRPETIQKRWEAMFAGAEAREDNIYALPVESRQIDLVGSRTFDENIRWNKRLLLQLFRTGLLEFTDLEYRGADTPDDDPQEWAIVKLLNFSPHTPRLAELIESQRNEEVADFRSGLTKMDEFLEGDKCASRIIGRLYNIENAGCPGCPFCRNQSRIPSDCESLEFPLAPRYATSFRSELIEGFPTPSGHAERANFVDGISRCVEFKGIRQFFCPPEYFDVVLTCFKDAFPKNAKELHRLDSITQKSNLSSSTYLPLVFFHIDAVNEAALEFGRNQPSVHLFCGVRNAHDLNGRHVAVTEGFRRWACMESWISQLAETSLPCLPTTQ
jgi:ATP-dependent DNA helicase RecQ